MLTRGSCSVCHQASAGPFCESRGRHGVLCLLLRLEAMKNAKKASKKAKAARMTVPVSEAESDRRLRPVLDALYNHNSRQALRHAQQALQRRPGWPAARALRACALLQSGHWAAAKEEIAEVRADLDAGRVPLDEDCARKLHMYYLEVRREEIAAELYERVWKTDQAQFQPAEIAYGLYIRGSAFTSAQKLATKLHRIASSQTPKYGMWATAALWLGLTCKSRRNRAAETSTSDAQMLKLASAMLSTALDASPTPSAEMVRFSLRVYEDGGNFDKARELVSNPRLVMDDTEKLQLRSEIKSVKGSRETDLRTLISEHDADDWINWMKFFNCVEKEENWKQRVSTLVSELRAIELASSRPKRGPFLAELELLCRLEEFENLAEAIVQFFRRFGSKTVCAHDLRPYLTAIKKTKLLEVSFDKMSALVSSGTDASHLTLAWMRLWYDRLGESEEELFQHYTRLLTEKTDKTERQAGDDYLLLIAHKLLPESLEGSSNRYADVSRVVRAILILETGLSKSPFNFHIKLLLMRLYREIGATQRMAELWQSLEIKDILVPTLIHLIMQPAFDLGHHDVSLGLLERVERLWRECDREVPECTSKAFRAGSINAAIEFVLFRKRLEGSAELAQCMIREVLHNLVIAGGEGIGVQRAFDCLSQLPRFTIDTVQVPRSLITNEDHECWRFWELHAGEQRGRMQIPDTLTEERGVLCPLVEQEAIAADLASLELLVRIAVKDFDSDRTGRSLEDTASPLKRLLDSKVISELPETTVLRMKVALNLLEAHQLLQSEKSQVLQPAPQNNALKHKKILQTAQSAVDMLLTMSQSVTRTNGKDHPTNKTDGKSAVSGSNSAPSEALHTASQLRQCGRMVFDTLLVTSMAVTSFSPELRIGKKRGKKARAKTGASMDSAGLNNVECARQVDFFVTGLESGVRSESQ
ncbi:unnamed protein product [Chondrus crispus]|uniref:Uncharacterized protein n=1 Tax=Chondrus crispus TaxID=2769 RepID=R7QV33_CHOCR|nr:unnamed protein product [Chondrus crispus]CDF41336.1 unnamed protein product [Chondrus crispus]|eukprot:XP_005711630.1 unnamed protein product [Chondrus crispus]